MWDTKESLYHSSHYKHWEMHVQVLFKKLYVWTKNMLKRCNQARLINKFIPGKGMLVYLSAEICGEKNQALQNP